MCRGRKKKKRKRRRKRYINLGDYYLNPSKYKVGITDL